GDLAPAELAEVLTVLGGSAQDVVVHVGHVLAVHDLMPAPAQEADQRVEGDIGERMAKVRAVVRGDAADVHGHPWPERERRRSVGQAVQDDGLEALLALYRQHVTSRSRSPPRPRMVQLPRWRADGGSNGRLAPLIRSRWDAGPWLVPRRRADGGSNGRLGTLRPCRIPGQLAGSGPRRRLRHPRSRLSGSACWTARARRPRPAARWWSAPAGSRASAAQARSGCPEAAAWCSTATA